MEDDSTQIKEHYNRIEDRGREAREQSVTLNIRNTNNFIKACLIRQYTKRGDSVLDLACGKGGDLLKYEKAGILEYYGVDIADGSINDARIRFKKMKRRFKATFKTLDAYNQPMSLNKTFNVISAQFSFHYAFSSDQSVDTSLNNVNNHLKPGGYFIMTIPCKDVILEKFKSGHTSNEFYSIIFPSVFIGENCREYHFTLTDSVNNCIEYLVDFQKMVDGFERLGLNLIKQQGFISFYEDESEKHPELFKKMRLKNLTEKEKEVIEIYQVVVFQRSG